MPHNQGNENLVPFAKGPDPRRHPSMGRPHALSNPDFCREIAAAFVAGITRSQMAEMFDVAESTISRWRRDPRIKPHAMKMIEDRVLSVTRKVDSEIEARLQYASDLTVKELLEIRKEFLAGTLRQKMEAIDDETMTEAMKLLEDNPELTTQLAAVIDGSGVVVPKENVVDSDG